mgnify:CR=1 FL=1
MQSQRKLTCCLLLTRAFRPRFRSVTKVLSRWLRDDVAKHLSVAEVEVQQRVFYHERNKIFATEASPRSAVTFY